MKQCFLAGLSVLALAACGDGNPFDDPVDDGVVDEEITVDGVPDAIAADLQGFSYDPDNETLTITGLSQDNVSFQASYDRKPGLDVGPYEAYTTQDSSLSRHTTVYIREIDGTRATIAMSGGQFGYIFNGGAWARDGGFDRPDLGPGSPTTGIVQYAGQYVGLLNGPGDGGDLLPVAPGTPAEVRPSQAAEITGEVLITADFTDNSVSGRVYDRVIVDYADSVEDLDLAPTTIDSNGAFVGDVEQIQAGRGTYGGVFGGQDSRVVAGALEAEGHMTAYDNEIEKGLFVLIQCGQPGADPICSQPNP